MRVPRAYAYVGPEEIRRRVAAQPKGVGLREWQPVLSAGEIFLASDDNGCIYVSEISNQSTGYCPEPESWPAVARALDTSNVPHPGGFTTVCVFRRCIACGQRNLVKDEHSFCDICGVVLPREWNFA